MGPGSTLGARYVLRRRLTDDDHHSTWQAQDETLGRRVRVTAVAPSHPAAGAVLDAARRAAGVDDARLVRVLDVGTEGELSYVVTEWLEGTDLAELLSSGPLAADEARTVAGEAALALETARRRGLHHGRLAPGLVHRLEDGSVKVDGLAVAAALAGLDEPDADTATHDDTRALVAVLYAGLTATWPLAEETGGDLPAAATLGHGPVPPSEVVSGVPGDLDTLCSQTFGGSGPPSTPSELAGRLAPWGRERRGARPEGTFPLALPPVLAARAGAEPSTAPTEQVAVGATDEPAATRAVPVVGAAADAPSTAPVATRPPQPRAERRPTPAAVGAFGGLGDVLGLGDGTGGGQDGRGDERRDDRDDDRPRSRTVMVVVGIFVVVLLLLAWKGLSGLGDNPLRTAARGATPKPSPTATATTSPSPTTSAPTSATPTATATGPISIDAATGFDPEGDGSEKDDDAGKATDGDDTTSWQSERYNSAAFGGLKKGVGLELDLGGQHTVTKVVVDVGGSGSTLQLRTADGEKLGDQVLAEQQDASGSVTLTPDQPVQASNLVLWFTKAAPMDGGYRVAVVDVQVS